MPFDQIFGVRKGFYLEWRNCRETFRLLEKDRKIQAKRSQELLATGNMAQDTADSSVAGPTPLIAKESEIIKAQAENANDLSIIISVLEISDV